MRESAKLRSMRAVVVYVPHVLQAVVLHMPYMLWCPACLVSCVLLCLTCLTCQVPYVLHVPHSSRALRALCPVCYQASGALYHVCPFIWRAWCLECLIPYELSYLTCSHTSCVLYAFSFHVSCSLRVLVVLVLLCPSLVSDVSSLTHSSDVS